MADPAPIPDNDAKVKTTITLSADGHSPLRLHVMTSAQELAHAVWTGKRNNCLVTIEGVSGKPVLIDPHRFICSTVT